MNRGIALLAAAALFASGLAVGALGAHLVYAEKITSRMEPPMPIGRMFGPWIERELDLTATQRNQVRAILDQSRSEAEAIRKELGPKLGEVNRTTTEALAEVLTPEQLDKMTRWMDRRGRFERRFRGEGTGNRGPRRPRSPRSPGADEPGT